MVCHTLPPQGGSPGLTNRVVNSMAWRQPLNNFRLRSSSCDETPGLRATFKRKGLAIQVDSVLQVVKVGEDDGRKDWFIARTIEKGWVMLEYLSRPRRRRRPKTALKILGWLDYEVRDRDYTIADVDNLVADLIIILKRDDWSGENWGNYHV